MFRHILRFELKFWIKNPMVYLFSGVFFALVFLSMWGMSVEANTGENIVMMNSYYRINSMASMFSLLVVFILPAFIGLSVFRDFSSRMYTLLYSFPFSKKDYLLAKFVSSFCVVICIVLSIVFGFILGSLMPGVKSEALLPFDLLNYLHLTLIFLIPNMLFFGSVVFAITLFTRNIYISFIGIIFLIIIQNFGKGILGNASWEFLAALADPTGETSVKHVVQFWTLEERNFNTLPMDGLILYNRLLWLGISGLIFWWTYVRFDFNQFAKGNIKSKKKKEELLTTQKIPTIRMPMNKTNFSFWSQLKTSWHISTLDFRAIVLSWPFVAILIAGGGLVLFQQYQMNPQHGIVSIPTTANMLRFPMFFFTAIVNLLTFLYVGVLIYKGKLYRMDGLLDTTPQPNWVILLSDLFAIVRMHFVLLLIVMLTGSVTQAISGYYRFELEHYLFELFILQGIHFFAWASLAICIHTISKNMYLGYFVLLLVPLLNVFLPALADYLDTPLLKENLLQFNSVKDIFLGFDYSEFDGYGWQLTNYFVYKFYWFVCSIGLLIIALLFWKRGLTFTWTERWELIKARLRGSLKYALILGFLFFIATGLTIYYQEHNVSKIYFSDEDQIELSVRNEKRFGHFENKIQPRLIDVTMSMNIFPETQDFVAGGVLTYINKMQQIVDTVIIAKSFKEISTVSVKQPHQVLIEDDLLNYTIVKLNNGLQQGDTLQIDFEVRNFPNTFLHHNSRAIANGTYITDQIMPKLGIRNIFLSSAKQRKKYDLQERPNRVLSPSDTTLLDYTYSENNMGLMTYQCTISTSEDQIPITMGEVKKKWTEENRIYQIYESKNPIGYSMSWFSGCYEKLSEKGKHQVLEMYRHPVHTFNDNHFFNGLNTSMDYCSEWFGPLGFDTMRIVEYPETKGTYATVHGNIMPYSESYFKCDVHDHNNDVFNMPFFVSAHEIAHCWWGHRVDPANIPGGRMITEGMADYLAMKAIEIKYGEERLLEFRKKYHKLYLQERAKQANETPLIHSSLENEYLNYRKASLSLYALSEYLGEDVLNTALAKFERRFRNAEPPFATSFDFVQSIKEVTQDSLQYLVHDMFETITLYDNSINEIKFKKDKNVFHVSLDLSITKFRADGKGKKSYGNNRVLDGNKKSLPLNDFIELGFFDGDGDVIANTRLRITEIKNNLNFQFNEKVDRIEIDPNYLLFEANREDNVWKNGLISDD
ncbi:MAG: M1 family aminopeptidase [Bacteroidota bacterium]